MYRSALVVVATGFLVTACASQPEHGTATARTGPATSHRASTDGEVTTTSGDKPRATGSKYVVLDGVRLTIPSTWPVVDGAHTRHTCSATFSGQADRALLGASYQGVPACPAPDPQAAVPRADGVWMQPARTGHPSEGATTLPGGQRVYLATDPRAAAVTVWYHRVAIQIGVGAKPVVQQAILDSISFRPHQPNSAVLGRCPPPDPTPPTRPAPTRLTAPATFDHHNVTLRPEPATVRPGVSATTAWATLFHDFGDGGFAGPLRWSVTFASYSAQTPAATHPNGPDTPLYRDVPTWFIRGQGVDTAYGPCGVTVYAAVNATTGRSPGVETIG